MGTLELLPAVDIAQGRAVRPVGGRLSQQSEGTDPVEAALSWRRAGARWIHLVDLDMAFGRGTTPAFFERLLIEFVRQLRILSKYRSVAVLKMNVLWNSP